MNIIGISAFYHDSAACLVQNGRVISAVQEERLTRIKHDKSFPINAISYCLDSASLAIKDIDAIAYYEDPFKKYNRRKAFGKNTDIYLRDLAKVLLIPDLLRSEFDDDLNAKFYCVQHHLSHAASAFLASPYDESAILTVDGVGEWQTTTISYGKVGEPIKLLWESQFPQSLGLFYSAITAFCGFKINSGEYKLMGLAPYGVPRFSSILEEQILSLSHDQGFALNSEFINLSTDSSNLINDKLSQLLGVDCRSPDSPISQIYCDIAASAQHVLEKVVKTLAGIAYQKTKCHNLVAAGGVALNCVANGKLRLESSFDKIWIQPASGDAGGSVGAALYVSSQLQIPTKTHAKLLNRSSFTDVFLGPSYTYQEIVEYLEDIGVNYSSYDSASDLASKSAELLKNGNVVALFDGRMEFGPRALGNRSILANPMLNSVQKDLNIRTKFRESFRPFAPIVLEEHASKIFENGLLDPYMLFVDWVKDARSVLPSLANLTMNEKLSTIASTTTYPAITHVDGSARVQTVEKSDRLVRMILECFYEMTGSPALVNTSFNIKNEPIVCTPEDAVRCFAVAGIDYLVMPNILVRKDSFPKDLFDSQWISSMEED